MTYSKTYLMLCVIYVIGGLLFVQLGQRLAKVRELWHVVMNDVWLVGVIHKVVLMIGLCFIEGCKWRNLRYDFGFEHFGLI